MKDRLVRRYHQFGLLLLLCLVVAVYWNSFPGAFHFDDRELLLENPLVHKTFEWKSFLDQYGARPLTLLTFRWNYLIGGEQPFGYHLVNVGLHALNVALFFILLQHLALGRWVAFTAPFLFAINPLLSQPVNYIWSRSVLLMVFFGLLALLLAKRRPWVALALFQLCIWGRMEGIVLAPLLCIAMGRGWPKVLILSGVNAVSFALALIRFAPTGMAWNHPDPVGFWSTQTVSLWAYLKLLVWPTGLHLDHQILSPSRPASLLLILLFFALSFLIFRHRNRYPELVVPLSITLLLLTPSLLIPNPDPINESRAYPAAAAASVVLAQLASHLNRVRWQAGTLAIGLLTAAWIPILHERNQIWNDDVALWRDASEKSPGKARAHYNLAVALAERGKIEPARRSFSKALALNPRDHLSYAGLGFCAERLADNQLARTYYQKSLQLEPTEAYTQAAIERLSEKRLE